MGKTASGVYDFLLHTAEKICHRNSSEALFCNSVGTHLVQENISMFHPPALVQRHK